MKFIEEESIIEYKKSKEDDQVTDKFIEIIDFLIDLEFERFSHIQDELKLLLKYEIRNICIRGYKDFNPDKGTFYSYFRILIRCGIAQENAKLYRNR